MTQAEPPAARKPDPHPPSVEEAARIVNAAWQDPDWGTFIWLVITVGARRGELCAVRWANVDLDRAVLVLRQCVAKDGRGGWYLKDTKTHQVFSLAPDNSTFLIPESLTQRCGRLVERLGIDTTLHALRHYSATEMISTGVDVRTVAGRLGHSGGGITTLRVYSAWRDEADQRAAAGFTTWMPGKPVGPLDPVERAKDEPRQPL